MLIAGHYEFEILFIKKDVDKNKILSQRTIYRRYHDIQILYQGLILYNPGCLIPKIPERNFWANIAYSNNKEIIEERKKKIENYLNYISKHNYLSNNPVYLIFISDEFERYREKIKESNDTYSLYNLLKIGLNQSYKYSKSFILNKISGGEGDYGSKSSEKIEIKDKRLAEEKLRLEKIINGTEKFINALADEISSVTDKINGMKNLSKITDILKDSNFRVEIDQNNIDEKFLQQKNFFSMESLCYIKMAENYEIYVNKIKDIHGSMEQYKIVTEALVEIFERKQKAEFELNREKNADFIVGENKIEDIKEMEEHVRQTELQFFEEISNYHKNIENLFCIYLKEYMDIKTETLKKNNLVLQNKSFIVPNSLGKTEKELTTKG